nr:MAG TPA: hypothetical protein [Caudoviricetes sp.]
MVRLRYVTVYFLITGRDLSNLLYPARKEGLN